MLEVESRASPGAASEGTLTGEAAGWADGGELTWWGVYHSGGGGTSPHSYCFVSLRLEKGRGIPKKQSLPEERAKGEGRTEGRTDGR